MSSLRSELRVEDSRTVGVERTYETYLWDCTLGRSFGANLSSSSCVFIFSRPACPDGRAATGNFPGSSFFDRHLCRYFIYPQA